MSAELPSPLLSGLPAESPLGSPPESLATCPFWAVLPFFPFLPLFLEPLPFLPPLPDPLLLPLSVPLLPLWPELLPLP